jgi:hypothetical protein
MASIEELKSLISNNGGVAQSNLFKVELPAIDGTPIRTLNLLCKAASLPGMQVVTQDRIIGAVDTKIAYSQLHDDVTLTFHVLNDYGIRNYFESWINLAIDRTTYEIGYYNEYAKTVKIYQLKKGVGFPLYSNSFIDVDLISSDKIVSGVELQGAFPTTMNSIELSDATQNTPVELTVQLSFRKWKTL